MTKIADDIKHTQTIYAGVLFAVLGIFGGFILNIFAMIFYDRAIKGNISFEIYFSVIGLGVIVAFVFLVRHYESVLLSLHNLFDRLLK